MNMADLLRDFTPGAYGIWSGVLMFAAWWLREWRETRKLSASDRLARREGYAKQVENLQGENRRLREDLREAEERHDSYRAACQLETDQLRTDLRRAFDEIAGLKRGQAAQAMSAAQARFNAPTTESKISQLPPRRSRAVKE